jgi:hypothetical protein
MTRRVLQDIGQTEVFIQELVTVGTMFLAEIDDEPLFAVGDRFFEVARKIEETRLEPIRMLEQILAREVVEAVRRIIGSGHVLGVRAIDSRVAAHRQTECQDDRRCREKTKHAWSPLGLCSSTPSRAHPNH